MSVEAIRLKNFMAFQDTGWIELRPITLLFGKNSSGKSVVCRALRLLKQSIDVAPRMEPFIYASENGVDVGDFFNMLHGSHNIATATNDEEDEDQLPPIVFGFRCRLDGIASDLHLALNQNWLQVGKSGTFSDRTKVQVELSLSYTWNKGGKHAQLSEFAIQYCSPERRKNPPVTVFAAQLIDPALINIMGEDNWWFWSDILHGHEVSEGWPWRTYRVKLVSGFFPFLEPQQPRIESADSSSMDRRGIITLLSELHDTIIGFLQNIDYIGPLRPEAERVFIFNAQRIASWKSSGLQGYLRYLQGSIDEEALAQINELLRTAELCEGAKPQKDAEIADVALLARVIVYERADDARGRNLVDMGSGLSQVLPLVVQSVLADHGSTVIIEQPELHLHPKAQVLLDDLFIQQIGRGRRLQRERESQREREPALSKQQLEALKVHFLVETHSEHILLGLRLGILETAKKKRTAGRDLLLDELCVYFVRRSENGISTLEEVNLNREGDLISIPEGFGDFFAAELKQTAAILRAKLDM